MSYNRFGLVGAAIAVGAGLVLGGAALGNAATASFSTSAATSGTSGTSEEGSSGGTRGGQHTTVTGDEAAQVTAAVVAKDAAVTVAAVLKDGDGSYDVEGTKAGSPVRYEVSADLKTISADTRGGHHGGSGAGRHATVTGDEAAKVTAAVVAKDAAVTVAAVLKDGDGSYDVEGTKAGSPVRYEVSADLKTITADTRGGQSMRTW